MNDGDRAYLWVMLEAAKACIKELERRGLGDSEGLEELKQKTEAVERVLGPRLVN